MLKIIMPGPPPLGSTSNVPKRDPSDAEIRSWAQVLKGESKGSSNGPIVKGKGKRKDNEAEVESDKGGKGKEAKGKAIPSQAKAKGKGQGRNSGKGDVVETSESDGESDDAVFLMQIINRQGPFRSRETMPEAYDSYDD